METVHVSHSRRTSVQKLGLPLELYAPAFELAHLLSERRAAVSNADAETGAESELLRLLVDLLFGVRWGREQWIRVRWGRGGWVRVPWG